MHIIPLKHGAIVCGESLAHYGTPRHSGRYPWGSGENPYHHGQSVPRLNVRKTREEIKSLKKQEKLHKRAGRSDWHEGKFSSRKLHRQEADNIKARRQELEKKLDEHIPMTRSEKLAKGSKKYTKDAEWKRSLAVDKKNLDMMKEFMDEDRVVSTKANLKRMTDKEFNEHIKWLGPDHNELAEAVNQAYRNGNVTVAKQMEKHLHEFEKSIMRANEESIRRTNKQAKDDFSYDNKVTEPIAKKYDAKVEEMNKYLAKYEKTRSQSDYEKYIAAEQKAYDYLDELAEHVHDVDAYINDRIKNKKKKR